MSRDTESHDLVTAFRAAQEASVLEVADQGLATLASMVSSGSIDVSPKFQRRDRWDAVRQSMLIESFALNVPVPPVYLAEDAANIGSYAVIDGKQRLTAISAFFSGELVLKGLERFDLLNGFRFHELPIGVRSALGMKSMRITTLLRQSDEQLKHEVFLRLNTGGEVLNAQEIRNVAYSGRLNDKIYELAEEEFLRSQFKVISTSSPAYRNMTDAEFVLRFFTLRDGWRDFSGGLRAALDRYMRDNRFQDASHIEPLAKSFLRCLRAAEAIWGSAAFKRPGRDQALAGMWDAQMISLSRLSDREIRAAIDASEDVARATDELFEDRVFDEAVRQATNTPERLRLRVEKMYETLVTAGVSRVQSSEN